MWRLRPSGSERTGRRGEALQAESRFERPSLKHMREVGVLHDAQFARWRDRLEWRDFNSVRAVRASAVPQAVFTNEARHVQRLERAAVVALQADRRRPIVVMAAARYRITWLTPDLAEQRCLRARKGQSDQEEGNSIHGSLAGWNGKKGARLSTDDQRRFLSFLCGSSLTVEWLLRDLAGRREKFPRQRCNQFEAFA